MPNVCNVPICVATVDVPPARPSLPSPWVDTHVSMTPPLLQVLVPHGVPFGGVCHGADAAPELGVDEMSGSLPSEVRVVARVVCVELSQVGGQLSRRRELVDVDVRVWWRHLEVVLGCRSHHNRHDVVATTHMRLSYRYACSHTHERTLGRTHARALARTHAGALARTRARSQARSHAQLYAGALTRTLARTHTHARAHTRTHAHAYTHTSIFFPAPILCNSGSNIKTVCIEEYDIGPYSCTCVTV